MPNTSYARGAGRERQYAERLEAQGWVVARCAGSKGAYDLMASRRGDIQLIEIKSDRRGPFSNFGPLRRAAHREAASRAGALPVLVWWPGDRKGPRILPVEAWPS